MHPAYIAGFLDADGSLHISNRGTVRLRFTSTDHDILEKIRGALGVGSIASHGIPRSGHRQAWDLDVHGKGVCPVINSIYGHLNTKRPRALLAYIAALLSRDQRVDLREVMLKWNRRGSEVPVKEQNRAFDPRVSRGVKLKAGAK